MFANFLTCIILSSQHIVSHRHLQLCFPGFHYELCNDADKQDFEKAIETIAVAFSSKSVWITQLFLSVNIDLIYKCNLDWCWITISISEIRTNISKFFWSVGHREHQKIMVTDWLYIDIGWIDGCTLLSNDSLVHMERDGETFAWGRAENRKWVRYHIWHKPSILKTQCAARL